MPTPKKYAAVSNRFPELQIGDWAKFHEGTFETDDEDVWAKLQKHEWWDVHIHPRDLSTQSAAPAETAEPGTGEEPKGEEGEESSGWRARRGQRGSR